jgi:hypothetical protein
VGSTAARGDAASAASGRPSAKVAPSSHIQRGTLVTSSLVWRWAAAFRPTCLQVLSFGRP